MAQRKPQPKTIPVRSGTITISPTVMPLYSDGMVVQFAQESFILSFLKVMHPMNDKPVTTLESRCVAQVVVTPSQMAENLRALVSHFKTFTAAQDAEVKAYLLDKAGLGNDI